ncbi:MAG: imidazole glycerol phosphate synthase subunit HisH [Victivallales bacterium]|nr:imidazole glycerol phosphate synthase subunit HisH [Victivallales bacterium]
MFGLIDYGMGNLSSVYKALKAVGAKDVRIISSRREIDETYAVILPGVGNFGDGMENLNSKELTYPLQKAIDFGKPFLGICLGMQLLMEESEEAPGFHGLGIFKGKATKFSPDLNLKVPHVGWNSVHFKERHPCIDGINNDDFFYFVHSYYIEPLNQEIVLGITDYGFDFCSCIGFNNVFATQFHPEKSQDAGLKLLKNFVNIVQQ